MNFMIVGEYIWLYDIKHHWIKLNPIAMARIMQPLGNPASMHSDWRRQRFCHVCAASWRFDSTPAALRCASHFEAFDPLSWMEYHWSRGQKHVDSSQVIYLESWLCFNDTILLLWQRHQMTMSNQNSTSSKIISKGSLDFGTVGALWIQRDPETSESWDYHRLPGYSLNSW